MKLANKTLDLIKDHEARGFEILIGNNPRLSRRPKWQNHICVRLAHTNGASGLCKRTVWAVKAKLHAHTARKIDGITYNTDTSKFIKSRDNGLNVNDLHYASEELYQKRDGAFFLYGEGGAASGWSRKVNDNCWAWGDAIVPLTAELATVWLADYAAFVQWFMWRSDNT